MTSKIGTTNAFLKIFGQHLTNIIIKYIIKYLSK